MNVPIILGIVFILITIRVIKDKLTELLFIGGVLGILEAFYFYANDLGLPTISQEFNVFIASAGFTYAIIRVIDVVGTLWFPPFKVIISFIDGK